MPSIELPNSRNMPVMTEFITAEGNGLVTLHETKKEAAGAALISLGVLTTLIHKAMVAGVRVTERCATGFRFAVPTYMERLVIINIHDWKPRQLMLEAFFMPENAQTKQIMPPPAALALMRPGFLERMKSLVETTLPPGFFPERLVLPPTLLRRPEGLSPFVPDKALKTNPLAGSKDEHSESSKDEPPACTEEPPACPEDVDSILEKVERELSHYSMGLSSIVPGEADERLPRTEGPSLGLTADDQGPEASIPGPAYLRGRSQK